MAKYMELFILCLGVRNQIERVATSWDMAKYANKFFIHRNAILKTTFGNGTLFLEMNAFIRGLFQWGWNLPTKIVTKININFD